MADEIHDIGVRATSAGAGTGAEASAETAAGAGDVLQSAFCGSLRSKKFFMLDGLANEASQYLDASNHCWCRETHMVFGPDGGRARPERCVPGRTCYSSALGGD